MIEAIEGQSNGVTRAHAKASGIKLVEEPTAEAIDSKLDKVNVAPIPTDDTPELKNVKDLGRYLPSHPAPSTVYSWVNDNTIPYYKQGKTLMFKKSEIDK